MKEVARRCPPQAPTAASLLVEAMPATELAVLVHTLLLLGEALAPENRCGNGLSPASLAAILAEVGCGQGGGGRRGERRRGREVADAGACCWARRSIEWRVGAPADDSLLAAPSKAVPFSTHLLPASALCLQIWFPPVPPAPRAQQPAAATAAAAVPRPGGGGGGGPGPPSLAEISMRRIEFVQLLLEDPAVLQTCCAAL